MQCKRQNYELSNAVLNFNAYSEILVLTGTSYTQSAPRGGIRGVSPQPSAAGEGMVCCDAESRQICKVGAS